VLAAQEPQLCAMSLLLDEFGESRGGDARGGRDHRDLDDGVLGGDVGVQAATGGGDQVRGGVDSSGVPVGHQLLSVGEQHLGAGAQVGRPGGAADAVGDQRVVAAGGGGAVGGVGGTDDGG